MAGFNMMNSGLRICIDSTTEGRLSGRVFSQMLTEPMDFADASQLLLNIDLLLDAQKYPQAFQRARAFRQESKSFSKAAKAPGEGLTAQQVADAAGAVSTFTVRIITRRSSDWQGNIDFENGTPAAVFSSALEFMRLLSELAN